jgi:hypothetical protein
LFATVIGIGQSRADDTDKPGQQGMAEGMPDMAEMMERWQRASTPGKAHEALKPFAGDWKLTVKMWMGGPDAEPTVTRGTSKVEWVLGGRFLREELRCELIMPGPDGKMRKMNYEGMGMTGHDNYKNIYVASWTDNMSTHLLTMRGTRHPVSGVFTFYGEMDEPMLGMSGLTAKYVNRLESEDKHVFSIYDLAAGDDYKVLEIVYERK